MSHASSAAARLGGVSAAATAAADLAAASAAAAVPLDPQYEFDCPQYRNFGEDDDPTSDEWFTRQGQGGAAELEAEVAHADAHMDDEFEATDNQLAALQQEMKQEEEIMQAEQPLTEEALTAQEASEEQQGSSEEFTTQKLPGPVASDTSCQQDASNTEHAASVSDAADEMAAISEDMSAAAAPSPCAESAAAVDLDVDATAAAAAAAAAEDVSGLAAPLDDSVGLEDGQTVVKLADAFAAVADTPQMERAAKAQVNLEMNAHSVAAPAPVTAAALASAPAPSSHSSVPSFLRPTAAYAARTAAVAEAITERAQQPHRRPMQIATRASVPIAAPMPANTPRAALDELARPRTVSKPRGPSVDESAAASRPATALKAARPSTAHAKVTVAQSPALSTRGRARVNPSLLSSEEEEVRRIALEREEVARTLKRNAALHDALAHAPHTDNAALPVRSSAPLTHPEEFHFLTSKRAKQSDAATAAAPAPSSARKESSACVSVPHSSSSSDHLFVTKPVPFTFQTSQRPRREPHVISKEEQELAELAAIRPFKALPLREDVLHSGGQMGVPRIQKAKPTEATSPQLATAARHKRKQQEEAEEAAAAAPATAAVSSASVSAVPADGASKSAKKLRRDVQPFVFATEQRMHSEFRVRQEAELKQEATKFVAKPLHAVVHPLPAAPTLTAPLPSPRCVAEHRDFRAKFERQVAEDEEAAREARQFKARPNPFAASAAHTAASDASQVLLLQSVKSDKPLTDPATPALSSRERAARRAEWEAELAARTAAAEAAKAEAAAALELQKADELRTLRAVMKPSTVQLRKSIFEGPDFVAKPSTARLTQPESPMLITKRRARQQTTHVHMDALDEEEADAHAAHEHKEEEQENTVRPLIAPPADSDIFMV